MSVRARRRPSWKKPKNLKPWKNRVIKGFPWPWMKYWNKKSDWDSVSIPGW